MTRRPLTATIDPDPSVVGDARQALEPAFAEYRRELTGFCYRMLGAASEAEDAVQETLVRAWRAIDSFEGRSSLRSWLYRIATNVCLDMRRSPQRRARPMEMGPSVRVADAVLGDQLPEERWVHPVADDRVVDLHGDPADVAAARESIRLAFVAALQHLPARQRARATLATRAEEPLDPLTDPRHQELLTRYVDAFERYDISALVGLLRDDVILSMPPFDLWLRGPDDLAAWFLGPGHGCRGGRLVPVTVNGTAAFGNYRCTRPGLWEPFGIQVIEVAGGRIVGHHNYLYPSLFGELGLPPRLES